MGNLLSGEIVKRVTFDIGDLEDRERKQVFGCLLGLAECVDIAGFDVE